MTTKDELRQQVARVVRETMDAQGIKFGRELQRELNEKLEEPGISHATIYNWLNATYLPDLHQMRRIAATYPDDWRGEMARRILRLFLPE